MLNMRLCKLDGLRGLNLISMMLFHGMWDIVYIFGIDYPWYRGLPGYVWQQCICCLFILLSGFSWNLGHHHLKRGLTVFIAGALVTIATLLFMPENVVWFGILTFMGSAMLLMIPVDRLLKPKGRISGTVIALSGFLLFLLTRHIDNGFIGFPGALLKIPREFYRGMFSAYLGFPPAGFFSTDYFPLLPWFFLYITGYGLYHVLPVKEAPLKNLLSESLCPPLEFIGRHTLLIYMLHQPLIYGLLTLFFSITR